MDKNNKVKSIYFKTVGRIALIFFLGFSVFLVVSTIMLIFLTKPSREVRVPDVEGKRFVDIYNSLMRQGLRPVVRFRDVYDIEDGMIMNQFPEKGRIVAENSTFKLLVSRSRYIIDMPNLVGSELPRAVSKLRSLHYLDKKVALATGVISYIKSSKVPENVIIDQEPKGGEKVTPNRKVNLLVSSGSKEKDGGMPDVTGQSVELCFDLLTVKGLVVEQEIVATEDMGKSGLIISQDPPKNSPVKGGDVVKLKVLYYSMIDRPFVAYEKVQYKIPSGEDEGLYEAVVEDSSPKRIRFSRRMKAGQTIQFIFNRVGNARINILCNKENVDRINIDAE